MTHVAKGLLLLCMHEIMYCFGVRRGSGVLQGTQEVFMRNSIYEIDLSYVYIKVLLDAGSGVAAGWRQERVEN